MSELQYVFKTCRRKERLGELKEAKKEFSSEVQCDGKQCTEECESYKKLKKEYCKNRELFAAIWSNRRKLGSGI
mgnify:CR=1 FL=1